MTRNSSTHIQKNVPSHFSPFPFSVAFAAARMQKYKSVKSLCLRETWVEMYIFVPCLGMAEQHTHTHNQGDSGTGTRLLVSWRVWPFCRLRLSDDADKRRGCYLFIYRPTGWSRGWKNGWESYGAEGKSFALSFDIFQFSARSLVHW